MKDDDLGDEGESPSSEPPGRPNGDYEIGYGKPPRRTQFQPGQSGNPHGRTAGSRGLKSELRSELSQLVTITKDGKSRRVPKRLLVLRALISKAAKGDVRAADKLISLIIQMEGFEDQRVGRKSLSDNDMQILNLFLPDHPASQDDAGSDEARAADSESQGESDQQMELGDEE
jgi:hypothetical protein